MRIKKHNNGNQYILTKHNMWVRDFSKSNVNYCDINTTINSSDYFNFVQNELQNSLQRYQWIDSENLYYEKAIIVNDGYDFKNKQKVLASLPKDVMILAVNGALNKWEIKERSPNYYLINNPYEECMKYLPKKSNFLPKCIASNRTNYKFLRNYKGLKYRYYPVNESSYNTLGMKEVQWQIDDYRNPICAAIGLAYQFGVDKLVLFCCDDSFESGREGAMKLENNLWTYPQQEIAQEIIDCNLHWLKNQPYKSTEIHDCSSGFAYQNASRIEETEIINFFKDTNA